MRRQTAITTSLAVLAFAMLGATRVDDRPNNPYGVQMGMDGGDFSDFASICFQWAADMVGEWGHVRVGSGIHTLDVRRAIRTLAICRAKRLIPVMTGLYVPEEYRIPGGGDYAPYVRTDGYPLAAKQYRRWAEALAAQGAVVPYYEVGNEINGKWKPEAYGRFIIAISQALKSAMPQIKVVSAGLAGNGADFLDQVLTAVPEAAEHIDCYGLHPYGANHPPAYELSDYCLKGHLWTAKALAKHGITNPRFVMTESGYELGNKKDPRYPRITDALRARYMVEAYQTIWVPDPRVVTLTIFMLQATHYPQWQGWTLINVDCTKTETYKALAAVPKPAGSDWMPAGDGRIEGVIRDADSGQPLERVFAYTTPGIYAAETGRDGRFVIRDVPPGRYEVHIFRDGFVAPPARSVRVRAGEPASFEARMKRVGLVRPSLEGKGPVAAGWSPIEAKPDEHYRVDTTTKRSGRGSQMLTARKGKPVGIWICTGYATAVPDRCYAAEIWVKGRGVKRGRGKGVSFTLAITDSFAKPMNKATVTLPAEGDFDWTPLTVTVAPWPEGRRLTLTCRFDAEAGTVWFDDAYCHYAEYPVPSRRPHRPGPGGTVLGDVQGEHEERIPGATVCLAPGNYWTISRSDGTYALTDVPPGTYDLWAFARGRTGGVVRGIVVQPGETIRRTVLLPRQPVPRQIQNAGFEQPGAETATLPGWTRYGEFDGIAQNGWHPELTDHPQGVQAHTGQGFAGSIAGSNVKNGGIYQTIQVDPDQTYEVSAYIYTYQTPDGQRGDVACRLGIDPTGGTDPKGPYVLWTPYRPSHKTWSRISLRAAANGDRMTIFLDHLQVLGLIYNLTIFDDVSIRPVEPLPPEQMVTRASDKSAE